MIEQVIGFILLFAIVVARIVVLSRALKRDHRYRDIDPAEFPW